MRSGIVADRPRGTRYFFIQDQTGEKLFAHFSYADKVQCHAHTCIYTVDTPVLFEIGVNRNQRPAAVNISINEAEVSLDLPDEETSTVCEWDAQAGYGFAKRDCFEACTIFVHARSFVDRLQDGDLTGRKIKHGVGVDTDRGRVFCTDVELIN